MVKKIPLPSTTKVILTLPFQIGSGIIIAFYILVIIAVVISTIVTEFMLLISNMAVLLFLGVMSGIGLTISSLLQKAVYAWGTQDNFIDYLEVVFTPSMFLKDVWANYNFWGALRKKYISRSR